MATYAEEVPRDGRRIKNKELFIKEVGPGSHIAERRGIGFCHHYLVENVSDKGIQIIHYGPIYKLFARVHEKFLPFDKINFELGVYLIWSEGYPKSREEKEKAICRARSRLGEDNYGVAFNNCEHFVTWALTGRSVSYQVQDAKDSEKFVIDFLDACNKKETGVKVIADGYFQNRTGLKQQNEIVVVSSMATGVKAMSFETAATFILNSTKQRIPEIPAMLKIDPSFPFAAVEKVLRGPTEKYADNLRKLVSNLNVVQTAQQAVGEKAGEKSIQAVETIALETAKKSAAAAGKEAISQAAKQAAKCAAIASTVMETMAVGYNIYKLNKGRNNGKIIDKDFQRGVCTRIAGAVGCIVGSTAGAYLGSTLGAAVGQILVPIPGVGAFLGSALGGIAGKALFSGVSGFLFDKIMK